ncbi:LPS assembly lipoprotein LptE [Lysobacter koreensis]|uniref:LPS-assembly lipoprotein LptE n=1 Tax=Lysobacter koreensis TaxID=266122 RepID=A0ABW2YNV7_9GAMM
MIRRLLPVVPALAVVLALSACGFHLRNALTLPPDLGPVRVVSVDRYSPLAESLAQALTRAGATAADASTDAAAVLDLLSEQWGDTPVAVDEFGRTVELSLRYAVVFELRKADGTALVPRQTIELARDYISNPVNAIGTEGEREILQREMRREMTASVLRRIEAVSKSAQGAVIGSAPAALPIATDAARAAVEAADPVPSDADAPVEPEPTPVPR